MSASHGIIPESPWGKIYRYDGTTLPQYVDMAIQNSKENYSPEMDEFLADCAKISWKINSPWDIEIVDESDEQLFPILVKHLQRDYSESNREGMIYALCRSEARPYAFELMKKIFNEHHNDKNPRIPNAAANALVKMAKIEDTEYFEALLATPKYGVWRSMFIGEYTKLAKRKALPVLRRLLEADETGPIIEALKALTKMRDTESREKFEVLLNHKDSTVRQKARRAISQLDEVIQ